MVIHSSILFSSDKDLYISGSDEQSTSNVPVEDIPIIQVNGEVVDNNASWMYNNNVQASSSAKSNETIIINHRESYVYFFSVNMGVSR